MRNLFIIFCALAFCFSVSAQNRTEVTEFQKSAGNKTTLLRGEQAEWYGFPANGNPYWYSAEFFIGDIAVQGHVYYDVALNIDAVTQRALVLVPGSQVAVALPPSRVDRMVSGNLVFVGITGEGEGPLREGFYQVLGEGEEKVFRSVRKHLETSTDVVNGEHIGYNDPNYRFDVQRYFEIKSEYWFRSPDGQFTRIRNKSGLFRCFGDRRKELRRAADAQKIDRLSFDKYCMVVLKMAER